MSLHVGLDLGGTNVKCAVVERDGEALRVLATDDVPERRRRRAGRGARAGRARSGARPSQPFGEPATAGLALPGHFDAERGTGVLLPNLRGDWVGPRDRRAGRRAARRCR